MHSHKYRKGGCRQVPSTNLPARIVTLASKLPLDVSAKWTIDCAAAQLRAGKKTPPQSALGEGLVRLEGLVKRYGQQALRGDPEFFITLQNQRGSWGEEFALDVLERQLRPKADEGFRQRNYCEASRCMSALLRALLRQSRRSWRLRRAAVRDSAQRNWKRGRGGARPQLAPRVIAAVSPAR